MAIPAAVEARTYYRCAFQRFDDAQVLLRANHTTGAVYLAGYGVECILKALTLSNLASAARARMLESFQGVKAHDYEWLRLQYIEGAGGRFPREATRAFTFVNEWSTDLRYSPRVVKMGDAERFLTAAESIIRWADERI